MPSATPVGWSYLWQDNAVYVSQDNGVTWVLLMYFPRSGVRSTCAMAKYKAVEAAGKLADKQLGTLRQALTPREDAIRELTTGGVLPYMTHLMNDARETLQMRDKRIAELEAVLRQLVAAKDEKDVNGETDRYRELKAGAWERAREMLSIPADEPS